MWQDELKKAIAIKVALADIAGQVKKTRNISTAVSLKALGDYAFPQHLGGLQNFEAHPVTPSLLALLSYKKKLVAKEVTLEILRQGIKEKDFNKIAAALALGVKMPEKELVRFFSMAIRARDHKAICIALLLGAKPHAHKIDRLPALRWADQHVGYRDVSALLRTWLQHHSRAPYTVQKSPANFAYPCDRTTAESVARRTYYANVIAGKARA